MTKNWISTASFILITFLTSTKVFSNVLVHHFSDHIFMHHTFLQRASFYLMEREYCVANIAPKQNSSSSATTLSAEYFTIARKGESKPFIVLCHSTKFAKSALFSPPSIVTVESCVLKDEFEKENILNLISAALHKTEKKFTYIHFENEPMMKEEISIHLDNRFAQLLKYGASFSEKIGCFQLNHRAYKYSGNILRQTTFAYSFDHERSAYLQSKDWILRFSSIEGIKKNLAYLEDSKELQSALNFLDTYQLSRDPDQKKKLTLGDFYKENDKEETSHAQLTREFEEHFLKSNNPLISQIAYQIFKEGLDCQNPFHRLLSYKVIDEAYLLSVRSGKDLSALDAMDSAVDWIASLDLSHSYDNYVDAAFANMKAHTMFPVEHILLSKYKDSKIKEMIRNRKLMLFRDLTSLQFAFMLKAALECVGMDKVQSSEYFIAYELNNVLSKDASWSSYFLGNKKSIGEDYLLWFFCKEMINNFEDFFINFP